MLIKNTYIENCKLTPQPPTVADIVKSKGGRWSPLFFPSVK